MGFFSWKTADTQESIWNTYSSKCRPVYLLNPRNEAPILEENYEGYGVFGGHDAYVWLAKTNLPQEINEPLDDNKLRALGLKLDLGFNSFIAPFGKFIHAEEREVLLHYKLISEDEDVFVFETYSDEFNTKLGPITPENIGWEQRSTYKAPTLKYPLKFSFRKNALYSNLPASETCPSQGHDWNL